MPLVPVFSRDAETAQENAQLTGPLDACGSQNRGIALKALAAPAAHRFQQSLLVTNRLIEFPAPGRHGTRTFPHSRGAVTLVQR